MVVFTVIYCFLFLVLFLVQQTFLLTHISFFCQIFNAHLLLTGIDDVLSRLEQVKQKPSRAVPRLSDTSDTSGEESNVGEPRRRLWFKKTYKVMKAWGASDGG